jgi:hypothetical protein
VPLECFRELRIFRLVFYSNEKSGFSALCIIFVHEVTNVTTQ